MSCIINILGVNFNVDQFEKITNLSFEKTYGGDLTSEDSLFKRHRKYSMATICVSEKNYDDFNKQVEDSFDFLTKNKKALEIIKTFPNIDFATVNFGLDSLIDENKLSQSFYFPLKLLQICALLGISIETTLYKNDMELILEKNHSSK